MKRDCVSVLFQTTKIQNFETNSQPILHRFQAHETVSDHKDTKFWNQFTTAEWNEIVLAYCFRPQRYKILKPIHNVVVAPPLVTLLFQTTKIQNFETNSQQGLNFDIYLLYCFRPQRYKILKPIHNHLLLLFRFFETVSDHKDTKFWNQFTTRRYGSLFSPQLFQTTKIQNFETNSQLLMSNIFCKVYCFRPQRYKILKPIHNSVNIYINFNTLFQTTKIQKLQLKVESWKLKVACGFGFTLRTLKTLKTFNWA